MLTDAQVTISCRATQHASPCLGMPGGKARSQQRILPANRLSQKSIDYRRGNCRRRHELASSGVYMCRHSMSSIAHISAIELVCPSQCGSHSTSEFFLVDTLQIAPLQSRSIRAHIIPSSQSLLHEN
eukprot:366525-Chlamydomonas_euryale.AAC.3